MSNHLDDGIVALDAQAVRESVRLVDRSTDRRDPRPLPHLATANLTPAIGFFQAVAR